MHNKQSVKYELSGLEDLITRIQRCNSDLEKESAMTQWTSCCLLNNQSAPHTMDFIFAKPWKHLTLTTIEDAIEKDMVMLNERIKKEQESLVKAQELHDSMIKKMKEFSEKKRVKPEPDDDDDDSIIIVEDVVVVENKRAK
jgi:hypothetical protein